MTFLRNMTMERNPLKRKQRRHYILHTGWKRGPWVGIRTGRLRWVYWVPANNPDHRWALYTAHIPDRRGSG